MTENQVLQLLMLGINILDFISRFQMMKINSSSFYNNPTNRLATKNAAINSIFDTRQG